MNHYELTVIVRNRETESHKEKVKEVLQKHGAIITKEDHWGIKKLAYEISKEREGYYMFMLVDAKTDEVDKIQKELGLNADILRYLFIRPEEIKTA
jgi:small subunit ribosomal protein S6